MLIDQNVSIINGDGGVGKSWLALQLAICAVTGRQWLGKDVKRGPVLLFSAEDNVHDLHRRAAKILRAEALTFADIKDLHGFDATTINAVLGGLDGSGKVKATTLWRRVERKVAEMRPSAVLIDTLANVFDGSEINRTQAVQFLTLCRELAAKYGCAVVILAHVSQAGKNSGDGSSGSTGWNNSVRSRLYLKRPDDRDERKRDPDLRILEVMKQNHGPGVGDAHEIRFSDGRYVANEKRAVVEADVEWFFLRMLDVFEKRGQNVSSDKPASKNFAPRVLAKTEEAKEARINERAIARAMDALLASGAIVLIEAKDANRNKTTGLRLSAEGKKNLNVLH